MIHAKLLNARLINAKLSGVNLGGSNLSGVHMFGADLTDADLSSVNLTGADLTDAKLTGASLENAKLADAMLSGADLSGAKNLTQQQLSTACGNERTELPAGLPSASASTVRQSSGWSRSTGPLNRLVPPVGYRPADQVEPAAGKVAVRPGVRRIAQPVGGDLPPLPAAPL